MGDKHGATTTTTLAAFNVVNDNNFATTTTTTTTLAAFGWLDEQHGDEVPHPFPGVAVAPIALVICCSSPASEGSEYLDNLRLSSSGHSVRADNADVFKSSRPPAVGNCCSSSEIDGVDEHHGSDALLEFPLGKCCSSAAFDQFIDDEYTSVSIIGSPSAAG